MTTWTIQFRKWAKDLNRRLPREVIQMAIAGEKTLHITRREGHAVKQWGSRSAVSTSKRQSSEHSKGEGVEQQERPLTVGANARGDMVWPRWKIVWQFPTKRNTLLPNDPATALFSICRWAEYLRPHEPLHSNVDTAALLTIARTVVPPTMQCYSALKRNELSVQEKTSRKLKCVWLSERSQSVKATDSMIPTIWHFGKDETWRRWEDPWLLEVAGAGMAMRSTEDF